MDLPAQKKRLRRRLVALLRALDPDDRVRQESRLQVLFDTLPGRRTAATVLLYVSTFPEEIATGPLLRRVRAEGKRLVCPRIELSPRRLQLFEVDQPDRDLEPRALGIPEPRDGCPEVAPEAVDWVLVPGLGFDLQGFRLGRGAGYYDRLLPTLRPDVPRWALAFDCQWVEAVPTEPHDVPLDGIASPGKTIERRGFTGL